MPDEIIAGIREVNSNCYADGLPGIGTGIEYLAREGLIDGDTNEVLHDFDGIIARAGFFSPPSIDTRTGIIGQGTYYLARLNNPINIENANRDTGFVEAQLSKIVDMLSVNYFGYKDLFFIMGFLPGVIRLNINRGKAVTYFNYAVDLLETMVYEDIHFKKYPGAFNPLIAAMLLSRSSVKTGNRDLADRAARLLEKHEPGFRLHLAEKYAIKWAFLYHTLWKTCNHEVYKELSTRWLDKTTGSSLDSEPETLIMSGMMLLSMNNSINDDWLDWFPMH